ncbi:MAG: YggS family pyridoxal phosphate-dependent enzyme [Oscillospiraceae bacterium]
MTEKSFETIADRVARVREKMAAAAQSAGRPPEEITLVGVTKTQSAEAVCALIKAGVSEIGENRVQELLAKEPLIAHLPHRTHLIGHLQRNKAKYLPGHVHMVQSVDSAKTAQALQAAFENAQAPLDVLIEVNIGEEASKSGASRTEAMALAEEIGAMPALRMRGLMAIPPFGEGEGVRRYFEQMYHLFIDIKSKKMDNDTVSILSMGMSSDYEYAILEGATMIRVGTELFGPR